MGGGKERDAMMERHRIVVSIIEINSQQLRCDSLSAGLDIERLCAMRDADRSGEVPEASEALADIERRAREVEERKRKLKVEREWLEKSLAEFDQSHPAAPSSIKRQ